MKNLPALSPLFPLALVLSACSVSDSDDGEGSAGSDGGAETGSAIQIGGSDDNKFTIDTDDFDLSITMPEIELDADDIDMNNVNLFPGSTVTGFNVEDTAGSRGRVTLAFDAPAGTGEVLDWFEEKMSEENFSILKKDNGLEGTTDEGDPFTLTLTEKGGSASSGELEFREQ